jgi:hypothetical protein
MIHAPNIFLSYNREDQARAKLLASGFKAHNIGTQTAKLWQCALEAFGTRTYSCFGPLIGL